ncbi:MULTISPECIES: universal stress protein [Rhizobium]|uniref:universal stress protein n=1 Tax=Rhizobium TaxID=379 RepID=UPI000BEA3EA2|nr:MULTISPECIES: universal stress protein [Rhizobium]MBY4589247.1 universal stress protein [Rhizobium redzepovicii]MBY4613535.1 universal stress protein [Rhizobium redzepovicii]MDR9782058.1 universal stress protein [Rhizobium redzepovicii]PDS85931.1 universal stress protein UspA [Rhizobium sp. L18]TBY39855.1 universal stress protein [Rhizobium leguminosarum bv. viciae]
MFATIVCAIGRGSRQRMLQLVETARAQLAPNGSLHLIHAVEGLPLSAAPDDWAVDVMAAAESRLSEALRSTNTPALIRVRAGNPSQVIIAIAKEIAADLVVIASHRDDVLDRVFGSVVDHVVQRAPCSVLVLRTTR